jgi:hypothetical protein
MPFFVYILEIILNLYLFFGFLIQIHLYLFILSWILIKRNDDFEQLMGLVIMYTTERTQGFQNLLLSAMQLQMSSSFFSKETLDKEPFAFYVTITLEYLVHFLDNVKVFHKRCL